jgi:hypothetical protein
VSLAPFEPRGSLAMLQHSFLSDLFEQFLNLIVLLRSMFKYNPFTGFKAFDAESDPELYSG